MSIDGKNNGATFDFANHGACGPLSDRPAVWYSVVGTGQTFAASVCTRNGIETAFGVFDECNSLICNGYAEFMLAECQEGEASVYTWDTAAGQEYFIHIRSEDPSEFRLAVNLESPESSRCINSVPIEVGTQIDGTTIDATFDFANQTACGASSDRPGVWYSVLGTGQSFTASACTRNEAATAFGILRECDDIKCVGYPTSSLARCKHDEAVAYTWDTDPGETYYIHIRSEVLRATEFTLAVSLESPDNDECIDATPIQLFTPLDGDVSGAASDFSNQAVSCGELTSRPDVWFVVTGNGFDNTASLCSNSQAVMDFGVFGGCSRSNPRCLGFSSPAVVKCDTHEERSTHTWSTQLGANYYIQVRSDDPAASELRASNQFGGEASFTLTVTSEIPEHPFNSMCKDAISVPLDNPVGGNNSSPGYYVYPEGECSPQTVGRFAWYVVTGTGGKFEASVCTVNEVAINLEVYTHCQVSEPDCYQLSSDPTLADCESSEELTSQWQTEAGKDYYILVRSDFQTPSEFILTVAGGAMVRVLYLGVLVVVVQTMLML